MPFVLIWSAMNFKRRAFLSFLVPFFALAQADGALVLRYTFDDLSNPATDSGTGTPAPGTFVGNGSSFSVNTPSGTGYSYSTSGSNSYITTGTAASPDTGSVPSKLQAMNAFTITTWVNLAATPAANDRLVSNWITPTGFDFRIGTVSGSNFQLILTVDNQTTATGSATLSALNTWIFLAVTYDGSTTTSNVNFYTGSTTGPAGQFGSTLSNAGGAVAASGAHTQIGGSPATADDRSPNALFDDVRIYDEVLTAGQIEAIRLETIPEPGSAMLAALAGGTALLRRRRK